MQCGKSPDFQSGAIECVGIFQSFDPVAIPQMALRGQSICILLSDEALAKQCRDAAEGAGATIVLPDSDPPPNYVVAESTAGPEFLVSRLAAHANRMMLGAEAGSDSHHL